MNTTKSRRRRAPAMSPDERRAAIVDATLPLLVEHGANVTTKQIAQAAEIAEGTVFRVFSDKEELLHTCVQHALGTEKLTVDIRSIPIDVALSERLTDAAELCLGHFSRVGILMNALATSGYHPRAHHDGPDRASGGPDQRRGPAEFVKAPLLAVVELLAPDEPSLRISADQMANMLFGLLLSVQFEQPSTEIDLHQAAASRVEVLLHGVLAP